MGKEILSRLFYSFLFSLGLSLSITILASKSSGGSESSQVLIIMIFYILFILLCCFLSSMTAFFNLLVQVKNKLFLSIISFFCFPLVIHIYTILQNIKGPFSTLLIFYSPSSLYLLALIYNFYIFKKKLKGIQIQNNK